MIEREKDVVRESPLFAVVAPSVPRVAISFSSTDSAAVDMVESQLAKLGISLIRYETSLRPQDRIDLFIQAIANVDAVLVVLSEGYCRSEICMAELLLVSRRPDSVYLTTTAAPDFDVPSGVAKGMRDMLRKEDATWVSSLVSDWEDDAVFESITALLSRRYVPMLDFETRSGCRDFISFFGFTPASHIDDLEGILSIGDVVAREAAFEAFLEYSCASEYYLYYKGRSFALAGYSDLAMAFYQRALERAPGFVPAYISLCDLAISSAEVDTSVLYALIMDASGAIERLSDYERALSLHALGLVHLSLAQSSTGDERLDNLRQAMRLFGESAALRDSSTVRNAEGQVCECLGRYDDALDCYRASLELDRDNHVALNNLALLVHNRFGRPDLAIPLYEKCLKLVPRYKIARENLALAMESQDQKRALCLQMSSVAHDYPGSRSIGNAALLLDEVFGERVAAEALYRLALEKNPMGCAPNYNMASFARRAGLDVGVWHRCMSVARGIGWSELVLLEEAMYAIACRPTEAVSICDEVMERLGGSDQWRYLRDLSIALSGRHVVFDGTTTQLSYYPFIDLVARLRLAKGDLKGAQGLYDEAVDAALPDRLPDLALIEETDFSSVLWRVEKDVRRCSSDRIMRSQIVTIDGDTADMMRERIESWIRDDE